MSESPISLNRSPDVWYDDGNVVLQVDDTLFKLYKGILSNESAVFQDMFSLPQPDTGVESYDGCLLVKLHDDLVHMKLFLLATSPPYEFLISGYLHRIRHDPADGLRKRIITILQCTYPDTLEEWELVVRAGSHHLSTHLLHRLPL
ncbi:uncharacterized protein PHACADRAFT_266208, partial [Phanerochaete carnosa HHB-10118-sp]